MNKNKIKIAPSILSADFAKLGEEVKSITEAGADYVHVDIMDGHFVPNLTIGPDVIKAIRPYSNLIFDVHLMISPVDNFIKEFADAGADIITIHAEAVVHLDRSIKLIKSLGKKAGISLVPSTPPDVIDYLIEDLDLILVMTVNPGFGGQSFLHSQLKKIEIIRDKIEKIGKQIDLQVDGGINAETAKLAIKSGSDTLVAGSYIFKKDGKTYKEKINSLKQ